MALQVWLPLDGDLKNQGLSDVTVTNFGATVDNNGKIGKCYNFDGSDDYIKVSSIHLDEKFSIAFWVKIITWKSWASIVHLQPTDDSIKMCFTLSSTNKIGFNAYNLTTSPSTAYRDSYPFTTETSEWIHLALVSDGDNFSYYQNGICKATLSLSASLPKKDYETFICYRKDVSNHYLLNANINDFRIYDHALSVKEVKEIAKGLVLHYPLNKPQANLLSKYVTPGQAAPGTTSAGGRTTYLGDYSIQISAANADTYFRLFLTKQLVQNNKYTFSCYVSGLKEGTYYNFPFFAQGNTGMGAIHLNHNGLNSFTFTMNNSAQNAITDPEGKTVYIMLMDDFGRNIASGQQPFQITQMKLEEGDKVTSFIPNESDPLYAAAGYASGIVYDCSGYQNNGTEVGTITGSSDTPRYRSSSKFSNSSYITYQLPSTMYYATYSFWLKFSSFTAYGAINMQTSNPSGGDGPWFSCNTEGAQLWAYFGDNSPQYTKAGSGDLLTNTWYHCAYVWDNGVAQWYLNGEKLGNAVTYTGKKYISNSTTATIGDSYTGSSWNGTPFAGQLSDFRVYATALSAADVKALYTDAGYVDKNGNFHAYEFVEI